MKIVIACFPTSAIEIAVFENMQDADGPIHQINVGYDDFYSTVMDFLEEYKIDEIIFFGPRDYITTLAINLKNNLPEDITITIQPNEDIKVDEKDLEDEAMEATKC